MKKYSKLQNAVLTIVTVLILVIAAFVAVWYNELSSISTIEMIVDNITKGIIPINMSAPEIGCSFLQV